MNREQTEDLKAFEQRLTECVSYTRAKTKKWKVLLFIIGMWIVASIFIWWLDDTEYASYLELMKANKNLTGSLLTFFLLYLFGVLDRCNAPNIIMSRCRTVLVDYNMSCDEQGKLILKRKPNFELWRP